jgi:hypothetical protein
LNELTKQDPRLRRRGLLISELHSPPVPLRPDNPAWKKLYGALESLAAECGGEFAFVIDAGSRLWCIARTAADLWTVTRKDGTVVTSKDHRVITTPEGFRDTTTPEVQAADRLYEVSGAPAVAGDETTARAGAAWG